MVIKDYRRLLIAKYSIYLIVAFFLCNCNPTGIESITVNELYKHASLLASDANGGRDVGKQGIVLAEEYIASTFKQNGLDPLPGQDFFLDFNIFSY